MRARGVIIKKNNIYLVKRIKDGETYWVFPGGGVKLDKESPKEAVIREVKEEINLNIIVRKLLYKRKVSVPKNSKEYEVYFLCSINSGELGEGIGPEYSKQELNNIHIPKKIRIDKINKINLVPIDIKKKVINDFQNVKK